jgi:hypothetical protein
MANRAGILHQLPAFLDSLRTMEHADGLADALIIVTLDEAAQQLCARLHRSELCVRDSWATTGLGALVLGALDSLPA